MGYKYVNTEQMRMKLEIRILEACGDGTRILLMTAND
jgi:hypothetical protein